MTSIWDYNKTPTSNTGSPPTGFGTGQAPSNVRVMLQDILGEVTEFVIATVVAGTADAITVTFTNAPAAPSTLVDGMEIHVRAAAANATTTPTLAVNAGTARTITKLGGAALAAGDIAGNLHELILRYNLANTRWELLNPAKASSAVLSGAINETSATIASAGTVNIGAAAANYIFISGTTTITAFDTVQPGTERTLEFQGILILTNNATTLILPRGQNITTAAGDTAIFRSEGSGNWRCINYAPASGFPNRGGVAQVVNTETGAVATGSTAFPISDSIPQNTAGDQYMSLAITPTNASSILLIDVVWIGTNSTGGGTAVALFQDATANALAASINASMNTGSVGSVNFRHKMTAGQTTSTTFKVRAGNTTGATTTFNGTGGAREFGGTFASSITITELLP